MYKNILIIILFAQLYFYNVEAQSDPKDLKAIFYRLNPGYYPPLRIECNEDHISNYSKLFLLQYETNLTKETTDRPIIREIPTSRDAGMYYCFPGLMQNGTHYEVFPVRCTAVILINNPHCKLIPVYQHRLLYCEITIHGTIYPTVTVLINDIVQHHELIYNNSLVMIFTLFERNSKIVELNVSLCVNVECGYPDPIYVTQNFYSLFNFEYIHTSINTVFDHVNIHDIFNTLMKKKYPHFNKVQEINFTTFIHHNNGLKTNIDKHHDNVTGLIETTTTDYDEDVLPSTTTTTTTDYDEDVILTTTTITTTTYDENVDEVLSTTEDVDEVLPTTTYDEDIDEVLPNTTTATTIDETLNVFSRDAMQVNIDGSSCNTGNSNDKRDIIMILSYFLIVMFLFVCV